MFVIKKSIFWTLIIFNLTVLIAFQNCSPQTFTRGQNEKPSGPLNCSTVNFNISSNLSNGIVGQTGFNFSAISNHVISSVEWQGCQGWSANQLNPFGIIFNTAESNCVITATAQIEDCVKSASMAISIQDDTSICLGLENLSINGPVTGIVGQILDYEVLFRNCDIDSATWNFGDGSTNEITDIPVGTGADTRFENSHSYSHPGEYLIQVNVIDNSGNSEVIVLPVIIQQQCPSPSELFISGVGLGIIGEPYDYSIYRPNLSCSNYTFLNNSWLLSDQNSANVNIDNIPVAPNYFISQQTFEDRVSANPERYDWSAQANFDEYFASLAKRVYMINSTGNCDITHALISGPSVVDIDLSNAYPTYKYQVYVPSCLQAGSISTTSTNLSVNPGSASGHNFEFRFIKTGKTRLDSTFNTASFGSQKLSKDVFVRGCKINEANGSTSYLRHLDTRNFYSINQGTCSNSCNQNIISGTCQVNRIVNANGDVLVNENGVIANPSNTHLSCIDSACPPQCAVVPANHFTPSSNALCILGAPSSITSPTTGQFVWSCSTGTPPNLQSITCSSSRCNFNQYQNQNANVCGNCNPGWFTDPRDLTVCFNPCGSAANSLPVSNPPTANLCNQPASAVTTSPGAPIVTIVGNNYQWTCRHNYSPQDSENRDKTCTVPRENTTSSDFVEIVRAPCSNTSDINSAMSISYSPQTFFSHPFSLAITGALGSGSWCTYIRVPANYDPAQLTYCFNEASTEFGVSNPTTCSNPQVPAHISTITYDNNQKRILMYKSDLGISRAYRSDYFYRTDIKYKNTTAYGKYKFTCPPGQVPVNNGTACGPSFSGDYIDVNFSQFENAVDSTGNLINSTPTIPTSEVGFVYIKLKSEATTFNMQFPVITNLENMSQVSFVPTDVNDVFDLMKGDTHVVTPSNPATNCDAERIVRARKIYNSSLYSVYRFEINHGCTGAVGNTYSLNATSGAASDSFSYSVTQNTVTIQPCKFNGVSINLGTNALFSRTATAACGTSCNTIQVSCSSLGVRSIVPVVGSYSGVESQYAHLGACAAATNCAGSCVPTTQSCNGDTLTQNYMCSNGNCLGGCPSESTQNAPTCICRTQPPSHFKCWTLADVNRYKVCFSNEALAVYLQAQPEIQAMGNAYFDAVRYNFAVNPNGSPNLSSVGVCNQYCRSNTGLSNCSYHVNHCNGNFGLPVNTYECSR